MNGVVYDHLVGTRNDSDGEMKGGSPKTNLDLE